MRSSGEQVIIQGSSEEWEVTVGSRGVGAQLPAYMLEGHLVACVWVLIIQAAFKMVALITAHRVESGCAYINAYLTFP